MADSSIVISHVTTAGIVVGAINWLKGSKYFPMITAEKTKLLRGLAVVGAALGAGGIQYAWHPESRALVFTIPTLGAMLGFLIAWAKSFIVQEITYQATSSNANLASLAKQILAAVKPTNGANPAVIGPQAVKP